jgi:hypothetical protein
MEQTSKALKLGFQKIAVRSADDFKNAYSSLSEWRVDAVALPEDDFLSATKDKVVELVSKKRIPSIGRADFAFSTENCRDRSHDPEFSNAMGQSPRKAIR